jgi:hypothetical protein
MLIESEKDVDLHSPVVSAAGGVLCLLANTLLVAWLDAPEGTSALLASSQREMCKLTRQLCRRYQ